MIGLLRSNHEIQTLLGHKHCPIAETEPASHYHQRYRRQHPDTDVAEPSTSSCEDLSVYNHEGPLTAVVTPGDYMLHKTWGFGTTHPAFYCQGASAEFAPQPSQSTLPAGYWFEHFQPFNGLATRDFGYQVISRSRPITNPFQSRVPTNPARNRRTRDETTIQTALSHTVTYYCLVRPSE